MTMHPPQQHPDDERLAALADRDAATEADGTLSEHVASCTRCGSMVDELRQLSMTLGELPDLAPSRPLRLLPPVATPASGSALGWARRLFVPALGVGIALSVVGGAGSIATLSSGMAATAGAPQPMEVFASAAPSAASSTAPNAASSAAKNADAGEVTTDSGSRAGADALVQAPPRTISPALWPVLLVLGLLLLASALFLRFARQPRAG